MDKHTVVAVDLAKTMFEIAVSDEPGRVNRQRRLSRCEFLVFFAQTRAATVVMEACGSAHHWARQIQHLGHKVVLLPPHQVRPYVTRNKTDRADAKGILEAYRNADIRPVPVQDHAPAGPRLDPPLPLRMDRRTNGPGEHAPGPAPRAGHRHPRGHREGAAPGAAPDRRRRFRESPTACAPPSPPPVTRFRACETEFARRRRSIEALAEQTPVVARLRSIPGVGLMTATALVAFVGDILRFPSGRQFASYLGLTPREYSSGLTAAARSDLQARRLLPAHAADPRCAVRAVPREEGQDPRCRLRTWALELQRRTRHNKAAVALANKLARIAWAVWRNGREFESTSPRRLREPKGDSRDRPPGTAR